MAAKIRLLLVDDHPLVRDGLRARLAEMEDMLVAGEAGSGQEALAAAMALQPDLALVDIRLPDMNGIQLARLLAERHPGLRVLVLSMYDSREYVLAALGAGARGYLLKDSTAAEIVAAIRAVAAGGICHSSVLAPALAPPRGTPPVLTPREREVLTMVALGENNKRIASKLDVSVRTVESHRLNLRRKLGIHTPAGLTGYALKQGWIKA